jgi:ABC-type cobalt transport system substrate-binding protein
MDDDIQQVVDPAQPGPLPEQRSSDPEEQPAEEPRRRRSLWGLVLVIVNIILFIIIVILLTQCGGYKGARTDEGGDQKIETMKSMEPMPGTVSVWIKDSTTIERVLVRAQVTPSRITDMAEGRYIVEVADGDVQSAAERIAAQKGVYDAGLVYGPPATP